MTAIKTLAELGENDRPHARTHPDIPDFAEEHQTSLQDLLDVKNGFFAYEGSLHVLSHSSDAEPNMSLARWNSPELWRSEYGDLTDDLYFFAQDVFGSQFCLSSQGILLFDPETGSADVIGANLEEWAQAILDDTDYLTGRPLATEWIQTGHTLNPTQRLVPRIPFVVGGEFSTEHLAAMDSIEGMRWRGALATQLRDLPDGAEIEFTFGD